MKFIYLSKIYFCNRLRMYDYLKGKGYEPFATQQDKDKPERVVFLYDTDVIIDALNEYQEKHRNDVRYISKKDVIN